MNQTITLTFCDQAENHVGMQKLGTYAESGFSTKDIKKAAKWFRDHDTDVEVYNLNDQLDSSDIPVAQLLIAKGGVSAVLGDVDGADKLLEEQYSLQWDTKAKMYGRVVDKHARHNLCFGFESQTADYENGKGTIISFNELPVLDAFRILLMEPLGDVAENLVAEGNYYYDVNKCGIGFHGDAERRKVIGVRLGATMPLEYQWYYKGEAVGPRMRFELDHDDLYIMSEKTTGFDWKKKNIFTLRHAAGCEKFLGR